MRHILQKQLKFLKDRYIDECISVLGCVLPDFLNEEINNFPELQDVLEDERLLEMMPPQTVRHIKAEPKDAAAYLQDLGGMIMTVEFRPYDEEHIHFDRNGRFRGALLAGYSMTFNVWGRSVNAALAKALRKVEREQESRIARARGKNM